MAEMKILAKSGGYRIVHDVEASLPTVEVSADTLRALVTELQAFGADDESDSRNSNLRRLIRRVEAVLNLYDRMLVRHRIAADIALPEPVTGIVATAIFYYDEADETTFFDWLNRMPCVQNYYGVRDDLFIDFNRMPNFEDLWELISFCRRYSVDMKQLAKFATDENRDWFCNPKSFHYPMIFNAREEVSLDRWRKNHDRRKEK